jgi:SAM-dependent methyltransferase
MMSPLDSYAEFSSSHFSRFASKYSAEDVNRVGWSSRSTQHARFKVLSEIGDLTTSSVLDVGCGVGDLHTFLCGAGFRGEYFGLDLLERNVSDANRRIGRKLCRKGDVIEMPGEQMFDYVLASGIFGLPHKDWNAIVTLTLLKMYKLCRRGLAANFLSIFAAPENDFSYHVDPSVIANICVNVLGTRSFVIRHDYSVKNNDFTIYAYRAQD